MTECETTRTMLSRRDLPDAMLAGMQLDVFAPLKDGPMSAERLADALGVKVTKLRALLYALVSAGLVTVEGQGYTEHEHRDWLTDAGFDAIERVRNARAR
ncbi:MAG: methyltransferase dimerization domain-containing protein [Candidatus Methylomirabilia bacterium]